MSVYSALVVDYFSPHPIYWNGVWNTKTKRSVMFPVWFFIVLICLICYLLYITRPSEETLIVMSKNRIRKMQFWLRGRYRQS
jgi:hypothetical protein